MKYASGLSDADKFGFYSKKLREAQEENIVLRRKLAQYGEIIEQLKKVLKEK